MLLASKSRDIADGLTAALPAKKITLLDPAAKVQASPLDV